MRNYALWVGAFLVWICLFSLYSPSALAESITFSGTGTDGGASLGASAIFQITGDVLSITLSNTATNDNNGSGWDVSGHTLTGLFFDFPDNPVFAPVSASVAPGSTLVQFDTCSPGPCLSTTTNVGGEFYFSFGHETLLAEFGIASSGYIGGSNPTFGGPNLDDPAGSGDGINFGLISEDNIFNPNGGLANDPLIRHSVILELSGADGLSVFDISNVSFQYGTDLTEYNLEGTPGNPIPEPTTILLLGSGIAGLWGWRYLKRKGEGNP